MIQIVKCSVLYLFSRVLLHCTVLYCTAVEEVAEVCVVTCVCARVCLACAGHSDLALLDADPQRRYGRRGQDRGGHLGCATAEEHAQDRRGEKSCSKNG